jgi:hypothetical protein
MLIAITAEPNMNSFILPTALLLSPLTVFGKYVTLCYQTYYL